MARALADMTSEERQACEGMWAEWIQGDGQKELVVIEEVHPVRDYAGCVIPGVRYVEIPRHRLSALFPRHDLPRAWNPDGSPVVMRQEWAARLESGGASITRTRAEAEQAHASHRERHESYGTGTYDMLEPPPPAPAGIQHRFTTEWEGTDE